MDREFYLGIETSFKFSSIALIDEKKVVGEYSLYTPANHNEKLFPMLLELFKEMDVNIKDVKGVGVSAGPGMFTSLRTGMAVAKTVSFIYGLPLKTVNTLDAICRSLKITALTLVLADAGKTQLYAGLYFKKEKIRDYAIIEYQQIKEYIGDFLKKEKVYVAGPGVVKCEESLKKIEGVEIITPYLLYPYSAVVAEIAKEYIKKGVIDDPVTIEPFYMRVTDAERKYSDRKGKE